MYVCMYVPSYSLRTLFTFSKIKAAGLKTQPSTWKISTKQKIKEGKGKISLLLIKKNNKANWITFYQLGFLNVLCSISILFHYPRKAP